MGIINRTMDASQQRESFSEMVQGQVAGTTLPLVVVPFNAILDSVQIAELGAPSCVIRIDIARFIAGGGFTQIAGVGASLLVRNMGLSGIQGFSLVAAGSTVLVLQPGDVVVAQPTGISSLLGSANLTVVLKKTQDRVSFFGNST